MSQVCICSLHKLTYLSKLGPYLYAVKLNEFNGILILLIWFLQALIYFSIDDFITARNPDEVGSEDCTSIEPFDLNHFFGEDGKIYGYKSLKVRTKNRIFTVFEIADSPSPCIRSFYKFDMLVI